MTLRVTPKLWLLVTMLVATSLTAEAPVLTLKQLFDTSDFVGMITVERLEGYGKEKYAIAKIQDVWKGNKLQRIRYRAFPTWVCDTSDAKVGQVVLVFLQKENDSFAIANSGQGNLNLESFVNKTSQDKRVMYEISEFDLLSQKEMTKLSLSLIQQKQKSLRDMSLLELKRSLQSEL